VSSRQPKPLAKQRETRLAGLFSRAAHSRQRAESHWPCVAIHERASTRRGLNMAQGARECRGTDPLAVSPGASPARLSGATLFHYHASRWPLLVVTLPRVL
jgi:hypothetical protein